MIIYYKGHKKIIQVSYRELNQIKLVGATLLCQNQRYVGGSNVNYFQVWPSKTSCGIFHLSLSVAMTFMVLCSR